MAGNWKRNAAPSSQIKLTTFLKSKGRMVSVFPRNDRAVFQIVFRRLLHVHMLVSIEWINHFWNGNDEYLNKIIYYKSNSSYQLRKLGMMFRVELKKVNLRVYVWFQFRSVVRNFRDMSWFLTTNVTFICWSVNETPLLKPSYHP